MPERGDDFLKAGDISSARLFYERAAEMGDGAAALRLGATFDPGFLARSVVRGITGDPAQACLRPPAADPDRDLLLGPRLHLGGDLGGGVVGAVDRLLAGEDPPQHLRRLVEARPALVERDANRLVVA